MSITTTPYGFIPTQVSGLVLWLDASDTSTITQSGGTITQWIDKSTSALTATGVSNPTLVANVQNGFPGISLNGSTQYFNLGNNLNMGTNQLYIFVVSKFNSTADGGIIGKSLYGSQAARYSLLRNGAMIPLIEASGGAVNNSGLNSDTSTAARLLNMVWDRSNIYLYQNGTSVFSAGLSDTSNLTNGNSLLIGAYQNSSGGTPPVAGFYMNGYIHEILMYMTPTGSPLSNTARQQIESYLAQKWGLTLGAGHPGLTSTVYRSTYLKNSAVKRNIATMTPFFTAFSPRQIPGCALWLDGADSSTISFSSGSNVSTWTDKSGNGRNATVYAGTPTYTTALGMTFNGSSSLQITYTASPILESMFVIIKFNSVSGQGDILSGTAAGQREYLMYVPYSPGTIYLGRHSTGPSGAINGGTVTTGSNYLLGYVFNGTGNTISFFQSGNTITSGTPQFTYSAGGTISVIGSYNGGGYLQGQIYEMIIYSTALSITERQRVESYLAQKWRLTSSLPSGHLHLTQPAGARTGLSLVNSKMTLTKTVAAIPQTIAGLAMWLDATKITGFANGATLTSWTDTIGNRTFSNVNGVTYQTSIINGLPAVYMNGPGPYLEHSGTPPALVSGGTIYAVVQNNADGLVQPNFSGLTFQVLWQMNGYANGWEGYPYNFNNTTWLGSLATGRRSWGYPFSTTYFKSPHIVKVVSITNNWTQSFIQTATSTNSSNTDTGTNTPTLIAPMRLGACMDGPGLGYYKGYFAEVLLYNRGLNSTEQTTIENYLKAKWNV